MRTARDKITAAGAFGNAVTHDELPVPGAVIWSIKQKSDILIAVDSQIISLSDACARYGLSDDTVLSWRRLMRRCGVPGSQIQRRK